MINAEELLAEPCGSRRRSSPKDLGVNLAGVLAIAEYDARVPPAWRSRALLPEARSAVVLGCGGRVFGELALGSAGAADADHPMDRFTAEVVENIAGELCRRGSRTRALYYYERHEDVFVDVVALGEACGLGAPGRLGLLIHPDFGPWFSLRALLLTAAEIEPTSPLSGFDPCRDCPAPCATACPVAAPRADCFDVNACVRHTRADAECQAGCAARRACVVGGGHAYGASLERRFRRATVAALGVRSSPAQPRGSIL